MYECYRKNYLLIILENYLFIILYYIKKIAIAKLSDL